MWGGGGGLNILYRPNLHVVKTQQQGTDKLISLSLAHAMKIYATKPGPTVNRITRIIALERTATGERELKFFQEYYSECQTEWIRIRPDVFGSLVWVQTVCKS